MPKAPKEYFSRPIVTLALDSQGQEITFRQMISVIVLFCAGAHIDGLFNQRELQTIIKTIVKEFGISEEHAEELYEVGEHLLLEQKLIRKYVDVVNETYNKEQKRRVFELLMEVTAADGGPVEEEAILRKHVKRLFEIDV